MARGILGLAIDAPVGDELRASLERMLGAMLRGSAGASHSIVSSAQAALAWTGRDGEPAAAQTAAADSLIVLDGELYGRATTGGGASVAGDAQRLLEGYLSRGAAYLAEVEGQFAAAIWDAPRRQCVLVTDKFGTKPLYSAHDGSRFAFASRIAALLPLPWLRRDLNRQGLVEFFAFGHLWNEDTFLTAVRCQPPATVAVFDLASRTLRCESYWRPRATRRDAAASLEAIDATFHFAVEDRTEGTERLGLSLSGGLDARTVLAYMRPASATCLSMGMDGSLDRRSAERLAELARCDYRAFVLDKNFLQDFPAHLERMVDLTDGHYLSQCIIMPTLPVYRELGIQKLLRGHAGELVHLHKAYNFSVDSSALKIANDDELRAWFAPRLAGHLTSGVDEPILAGVDRRQFDELADGALRTALAATSHWDHPVDRISQLFLDQRTHRETAMSLSKISSVADVRVPYLDGRFVEAVFSSPVDLRIGERIQTDMLTRRRPEFLRPANSNTGAPVGASAAYRTFCYWRMRVFAKLGVKGYQPYERLGLWLREDLRPVVESILLAPSCLDRSVLAPDAVRAVVRRHLAGEQNHTYLIMAMMILETGFQRLLDGAAETLAAGGPPAPPQRRSPAPIG